jgi:hypothetical protein
VAMALVPAVLTLNVSPCSFSVAVDNRQVARLAEWAAAKSGIPVVRVEAEVRSGVNGVRRRV